MKSVLLATAAVLAFGLFPRQVTAHGYLRLITVNDNASTTGLSPKTSSKTASAKTNAIRQVSEITPVKGAMNADINCGIGAQKAMGVVDVMPGDVLALLWSAVDGTNWFHETGPVLTYMASCGTVTCDKFDSTTAKWFKIDQLGKRTSGDGWMQADLDAGKPNYATLPSTLAAGNYLLRHEIIALHQGNSLGGAEFYPACVQMRVGGSQTGIPAQESLVSFPGAYADEDAGILVPDIFETYLKYVFPGPPIAVLSSGSAASSSDAASVSKTADSSSASISTSAKTSTGSTTSTKPTSSSTKKMTTRTTKKQASTSVSTARTTNTVKSTTTSKPATSSRSPIAVLPTPTPTNKPTDINPPILYCDTIVKGREEYEEDEDDGEFGDDDDEEADPEVTADMPQIPPSPSSYPRVSSTNAVIPRRRRQMHRIMHRYRSITASSSKIDPQSLPSLEDISTSSPASTAQHAHGDLAYAIQLHFVEALVDSVILHLVHVLHESI